MKFAAVFACMIPLLFADEPLVKRKDGETGPARKVKA